MSRSAKSGKTVVITGASAGIGRALALEFAARGYHLGLTARRLNVLDELRKEIFSLFGSDSRRVELAMLDVDNDETVAPSLHALFDTLGKVDILVVNAGVNDFTRVGKGDLAKEKRLIQTNLVGAIATVNAGVEHFLACGGGQIVGISSIASLQAVPKQAAYCATKAGFSMYLDTARVELRHKNIHITKILPGFVKTEIMADIDKYPFVVTAQQAAKEIVTAVEKEKKLAVVPAFPWKWMRPLFGHMPDRVWGRLK